MADHDSQPRVVDVDRLDWSGTDDDGGRWKRLGRAAGGEHLGCTLEEIQPGGRPSRYHYHVANEESLYVLDGDGTLRTPSGEAAIGSGDYVSFPAGDAGAHAVENTSDEPLTCLFFSTMREPDIVVYPDDGKLHVVAGQALGGSRREFTLEADLPSDADATADGE